MITKQAVFRAKDKDKATKIVNIWLEIESDEYSDGKMIAAAEAK